jgi:glycosyltransferase involved in cell wall biosynthesis
VSEPAAADLRERGIADPVVIPNGWDPESHDAAREPTGLLDPDRTSLLYAGRFGSYGRDPAALAEALARLARDDPEAAARLELAVAGPLTEAEATLFSRDVAPAKVSLLGSIERERVLSLEREADALLLIAQPTRSQLLNIKLFEYLAAGPPILALAAGTEAGRVVEELGGGSVRADDPGAIAAALARLARGELAAIDQGAARRYEYPAPAEAMASAVETAIEGFSAT